MKKDKDKTISKTIRIPIDDYKDIEAEAIKKNTDFCKVANYRMKHFNKPFTPEIAATICNFFNTCYEVVEEYAPPQELDKLNKLKKEMVELCSRSLK